MTPPLTEATVRALVEEVHDATVTWEGHTFAFMFIGKEPIRQRVKAETVKALAADWLVMRAVLEECRDHVAFAADWDKQSHQAQPVIEKSSAALARLDAVLKGGRDE